MSHHVILDRLVWFDKKIFPLPTLQNMLSRDLSIFVKDEKYGRHISMKVFEGEGQIIGIPRQYFLKRFYEKDGHAFRIYDGTKFPASLDFPDFSGDLRVGQTSAVNDIFESLKTMRGRYGGLIEAECGVGKTVAALYIASILKVPTLVLVHKNDLLEQWEERIHEFLPHCRVGRIQQKRRDFEGKHITIGMFATITSQIESLREAGAFGHFGLVIIDEAHHTPASTFEAVVRQFEARVRLGLSATFRRNDGLEFLFHWHIGPLLTRMKGERVTGTYFQVPYNPLFTVPKRGRSVNSAKLITLITQEPNRNNHLMGEVLKALNADRKVLVLTDRREHAFFLQKELRDRLLKAGGFASVGLYLGGMKKDELKRSSQMSIIIASYQMMCIPSTTLFKDYISGEEKQIQYLKSEECVLSYDVSSHRHQFTDKGTSFMEAGKKDCIRIKHLLGNLDTSKDHRVLTDDGWKEAVRLTAHDFLISPRVIDVETKDIKELSKYDLYLLGALIGDGCMVQKGFIEFTSDDKELVERCDFILRTHGMYLKENRSQHFRSRCLDRGKYSKKNLSWLQSVLRKYRMKNKCENKTIPEEFMFLPKEKIRFILAGLIDTDGHVDKEGLVGFCGKNKALVNQCVTLFSRLGFVSSKVYFSSSVWHFRLPRCYGKRFLNEIPLVLEKKRKNLRLTDYGVTKLDIVPVKYVIRIKEALKEKTISFVEACGHLKKSGYTSKFLHCNKDGGYLALSELISHFNLDNQLLPNIRWIPILDFEELGEQEVGDISIPDFHCYSISDVVVHNSEGTDIPDMDTCFLATPRADVEQPIGRIQRVHKGKKEPVVVDYVDNVTHCRNMAKKRKFQVAELGFTIKA